MACMLSYGQLLMACHYGLAGSRKQRNMIRSLLACSINHWSKHIYSTISYGLQVMKFFPMWTLCFIRILLGLTGRRTAALLTYKSPSLQVKKRPTDMRQQRQWRRITLANGYSVRDLKYLKTKWAGSAFNPFVRPHGYTQCVLVRNTVCKNNSNLLVHSSIDTRSFRHCRWKSRISTSIGAFHIAAIESWYCYKKVEIVSRSISGALVWGWKHHCL